MMQNYSQQSIDQSDIIAVCEALKGESLTGGKKVDEFEKAICEYLGVKFAVVFNSATSALHAAYLCLGVGENDEVITTPLTFAATANAAIMCGADVKFVDILPNANINPQKIKEAINPNTKVVTSVDFAGNSVNADEISQICKEHNLKFLSDSSHALGSEFCGKKVGNFADISVFSFHAIKPITTFEGGAIVTNDENLAINARLFRSHGMLKKKLWDSDMVALGYNYRLSDVACALGINQLKKLDKMIEKRAKIARVYDEKFANNPYFATILPKYKSSYHLYPILLYPEFWCAKEDIFSELKSRGIGVQVHYKPVYKFSFYEKKYGKMSLKNAEDFYKAEISIACHQEMSEDEANFVANSLFEILSFYKGCKK